MSSSPTSSDGQISLPVETTDISAALSTLSTSAAAGSSSGSATPSGSASASGSTGAVGRVLPGGVGEVVGVAIGVWGLFGWL